MYHKLKCAIIWLIVDSTLQCALATVPKSFKDNGIVPDVVQKAPQLLVTVKYPCGVSVKLGNELTPTQVKDTPCVSYEANQDQFYTLALTDPDVPSRKDPNMGEFIHWLVGNIPGCNVSAGEPLAAYISSAPPENTGLHRYVFLVYQQPGKLSFDGPRLLNTSEVNRYEFSISEFANKMYLGNPIAGNFYLAKFDAYVPILNKRLGN